MAVGIYVLHLHPGEEEIRRTFLREAAECVDPVRCKKVQRLKSTGAKAASLGAGMLLQKMALDLIDGIVNIPKKFNLSHSGDYVVCAVGDGEVGADIQKWVPYKERTAERFFAPTEWKLLQELPASQRTELFYRLWSRKEAYGKYTGQGIGSAVGEDFSDEQNWQEKQICFWERVLEDSYSLAVCYGTAEA